MKKSYKIILALFAVLFLSAGMLSAQEENQPVKKIQYNFINEYGGFFGKNVGFTGVFVNGITINQVDAIGIGVGYGINTATFQEVPLFLNYRHYFDRGRKLVPCINAAVGASFHFWEDLFAITHVDEYGYTYYDFYDYVPKKGIGLYATVAGGFRVKAFSFTGGFFFRTFPNDKSFNGGIEVKVGYTF
ncbi:MAG: hypothetical protein K6A41_00935 [Bacteroidales bacterium]|nr:hypothetical protein [Bacteroidales bacterium]